MRQSLHQNLHEIGKLLLSERAQSLVELLASVAIASIIGLGVASFAAYGVDQFNVLVDQNLAEKSVVQAAFYLRNYLSQAVSTSCVFAAMPAGTILPASVTVPIGISQGSVDCRGNAAAVVWAANTYNAIAIFNRENGGSVGAPPNNPTSSFQGVGIYFTPGAGTTSGFLTFARSGAAANTVTAQAGDVFFDRLVDVQVTPGSLSTNTFAVPQNLKSIGYTIKARYFTTQKTGGLLYDLVPALPASSYRDLAMNIIINFHDNYMGIDTTGNGYTERGDGGMYFFKFNSPEFVGL